MRQCSDAIRPSTRQMRVMCTFPLLDRDAYISPAQGIEVAVRPARTSLSRLSRGYLRRQEAGAVAIARQNQQRKVESEELARYQLREANRQCLALCARGQAHAPA